MNKSAIIKKILLLFIGISMGSGLSCLILWIKSDSGYIAEFWDPATLFWAYLAILCIQLGIFFFIFFLINKIFKKQIKIIGPNYNYLLISFFFSLIYLLTDFYWFFPLSIAIGKKTAKLFPVFDVCLHYFLFKLLIPLALFALIIKINNLIIKKRGRENKENKGHLL